MSKSKKKVVYYSKLTSVSQKKKIENILLIFPHRVSLKGYKEELAPPLGLAYIAAVLEQEKYNVKIIDVGAEDYYNREKVEGEYIRLGLSYDELEKSIREFNPDVVGVSCLFSSQFVDMCNICKLSKNIDKNIITVVGGEHPSAMPEESLEKKYIDFVVIGEGDYSMGDLMKCLNEDGNLQKVDGLGFKKDKKMIINQKVKYIENLDELPLPARHLLPMETYFKINFPQAGTSLKSPNTSIMTSRGCTARCIFCATSKFWGNKFRTRSVEKVLDELEHLKNEYGVKEVQFIDDNLTLDKKRAIRLFNGMIERKLDLVWCTPQGIALWSLDEEVLRKMKDSGCYEITLAIESGDKHVLNQIIRKPLKIEKVEPLVRAARKMGMITKGFFVVGLPGETLEQMQKTFDFAKKLKLDAAAFAIASPLPGTDMYTICKEKGYLKKNFSFDKLNYGKGNIETEDFTAKEVERLVSKNTLLINLGLLYRNPVRFFKKYLLVLRTNPKEMIGHVFFLVKKLSK